MSSKTGNTDKIEFKDFFRFTKNGRMKSGTLVYSFSLAGLFLIVYGAVYYFLIDFLAPLTESMPIWASDLVGAVVPAVAGTLICMLPVLLLSERKYALLAYLWLAVFSLVFLIAMIIQLKNEKDALLIFIRLYLIMVPASLITGSAAAWFLYRKQSQ